MVMSEPDSNNSDDAELPCHACAAESGKWASDVLQSVNKHLIYTPDDQLNFTSACKLLPSYSLNSYITTFKPGMHM